MTQKQIQVAKVFINVTNLRHQFCQLEGEFVAKRGISGEKQAEATYHNFMELSLTILKTMSETYYVFAKTMQTKST